MPTRIPRKVSWRTQVKQIEFFHLRKLLDSDSWSVRRTAKMLNRSLASVSEDLRLSLAIRIFPEVENFNTKRDALEYLKLKHRCQLYTCQDMTAAEKEIILDSIREELLEGARKDA